jgi:hypothetical protein
MSNGAMRGRRTWSDRVPPIRTEPAKQTDEELYAELGLTPPATEAEDD